MAVLTDTRPTAGPWFCGYCGMLIASFENVTHLRKTPYIRQEGEDPYLHFHETCYQKWKTEQEIPF